MSAKRTIGFALLGVLALAGLLAPWAAGYLGLDPYEPDLFARFEPPGGEHPLGTDDLGRDVLLRLMAGARVSLGVGVATALVAAALGTIIGLLAAWRGGWMDAALMRLADGLLALPALPLLVLLAAMDPGVVGLTRGALATDMIRIVLILAGFGWVGVARLTRAGAMSVLARDHVRAARALGVSEARLLWRHVLPALASPVAVATALTVGGAILAESVLSFLGLGITPPAASWGNMLANAQEMVFSAPLAALWPGLAILLAVLACNLLADSAARR